MHSFSRSCCVPLKRFAALFVLAGGLQIASAGARRANASSGQAQGATPHAKIELIADWPGASSAANTLWTGILFHLDPGWHIYWQNAGDSGTPPKIDWQLPAGYHAGTIQWPAPVRLGHGSVVDYGYQGEVLLMAPIERSPTRQQQASARNDASAISAEVHYVVCSAICVPGRAHVSLSRLTNADWRTEASNWRSIFQRTRTQLPRPQPASWTVSAQSLKDDFVLSVRTRMPVKRAAFFPLDTDEIENSAPQAFTPTSQGFRLTLRKSEQLATSVATLKGLVVLARGQAFLVSAPVATR